MSMRSLATLGKRSPKATRTLKINTVESSHAAMVKPVSRRTRRRSRSRIVQVCSRTSGRPDNSVTPSLRRALPRSFCVMVMRLQHSPQGELGVMNSGPHGPDGAAGDRRDAFIRHLFEESQDKDLAMF